jgi:hypothetical protein
MLVDFRSVCRLRQSPTIRAATIESLLLTVYAGAWRTNNCTVDVTAVGRVDSVAVCLLRELDSANIEMFILLGTYGDGNCCYRAVALGLLSSELMHLNVRLMTAIEMLLHRISCDTLCLEYVGTLIDDRVLTSSYLKLIADVIKPSRSAELIHV